jgi:inorganic pyrophosphatase
VQNSSFWDALDRLVATSEVVIDRPKGTRHPKYSDMLYEVDYGYLKNTSSMDGGGIDVWRGTDPGQEIDAVMCIVDLMKRDSEIKILIGCKQDEKDKIYQMHNGSECMKGILILRN